MDLQLAAEWSEFRAEEAARNSARSPGLPGLLACAERELRAWQAWVELEAAIEEAARPLPEEAAEAVALADAQIQAWLAELQRALFGGRRRRPGGGQGWGATRLRRLLVALSLSLCV
jgi:hypothetical protein